MLAISLPIMCLLFAMFLYLIGRWYYRRRILSRARECIITGEPVKHWMSPKIYRGLLLDVSRRLLDADDVANDTDVDIKDKAQELYQKYSSEFPLELSMNGYMNKPREITDVELEEIIIRNIRKFKWRVKRG